MSAKQEWPGIADHDTNENKYYNYCTPENSVVSVSPCTIIPRILQDLALVDILLKLPESFDV